MNNLNKILLGLVFVLAMASCSKATFITPNKSELSFSKASSSDTIIVSSDGSWNVENTLDWVSIDQSDSILILSVTKNETGETRTGEISLKGGEVTASISISQVGKCTKIIPQETTIVLSKDGESKDIALETDGDNIIVLAPDWLKANIKGSTLSLCTDKNDGTALTGKIVLSCDDQKAEIEITQEGNVCSRCMGKGTIKCPDCDGEGLLFAHSMSMPCETCGGSYENYREGTGKIKCPQCKGK